MPPLAPLFPYTTLFRSGWFCHTPLVAVARNVSQKRAMELGLTGDTIDARTALDWGLVNHVVPAEQLDDATVSLLRRATRGGRDRKSTRLNSSHSSISYAASSSTLSLHDALPIWMVLPHAVGCRGAQCLPEAGNGARFDRGHDRRPHGARLGARQPRRPGRAARRRHRQPAPPCDPRRPRSEEHTSELQSQFHLVCRL